MAANVGEFLMLSELMDDTEADEENEWHFCHCLHSGGFNV